MLLPDASRGVFVSAGGRESRVVRADTIVLDPASLPATAITFLSSTKGFCGVTINMEGKNRHVSAPALAQGC